MNLKHYSEEQAFTFLQNGKEKGLAYYYAKYDTALVYFALRITGEEAEAEDIVSEAFVKLWQARESLTHPKVVKAYLYRLVRNEAINFLRHKKRQSLRLQEVIHLERQREMDTAGFEISAETHRLIFQAIENLPPRCGQIFKKFYLEQKTLQQIADELGISINTVRNQKVQALSILRKAFPFILYYLAHIAKTDERLPVGGFTTPPVIHSEHFTFLCEKLI